MKTYEMKQEFGDEGGIRLSLDEMQNKKDTNSEKKDNRTTEYH
jgi:hypothetical protein